jgi:hypothetical protein
MTINVDTTRLEHAESPPSNDEMEIFLRSGFQKCSAEVGGMSSSTILGGVVFAVAVGTMSVAAPFDPASLQTINVHFVLPGEDDQTDDNYSRIRQEIAASGIPMLNDDELRREIRERKGSDFEI